MSRPPRPIETGAAAPEAVATRRVRWQAAYRLVPSRYPPIDLFERIADPQDWETLIELESLTNPRIRDEVGSISLVPKPRRVSGPGASIVMAPFTHASLSRPTRFSDGSYGIYYAARAFETALREVAFHMQRFHAATRDPPLTSDYRTYQGKINRALHDITTGDWAHLLQESVGAYAAPQAFARSLRDAGSNGIVYPSVRHSKGECVAAFWPDAVAIPTQTKHIALKWDGKRISQWFDYADNAWSAF